MPFTERGGAILETELRAALLRAIDAGILADDTEITIEIPKVSEISANDRANRIFKTIRFTARLAGAIHYVEIRGVVTA